MRNGPRYIWQHDSWPFFEWDQADLTLLVSRIRLKQGRLLGRMESLVSDLRRASEHRIRLQEAVGTSLIEGEQLKREEVRSSIARRLGIDDVGLPRSTRQVDGLVEMLSDATTGFREPLSTERLFQWHRLLFPDASTRAVGAFRRPDGDPMQVVSGPMGRETVHFEAPPAGSVAFEMRRFVKWFERRDSGEPLIKAALAHLAFVTIHPFEDGNGRIARALTDMQLARSEDTGRRFYSMSDQIVRVRDDYYHRLERTQKGGLDVTEWIRWFLDTLDGAIDYSNELLAGVLRRDRFWRSVARESLNERQIKVLGISRGT